MPKANPFNIQCPNCGSYDVQFFPMYCTGLDVVLASIVTVGLALPVMLIAYTGSKIAKNKTNKKYSCNNCSYEWRVTH